MDYQKILDTLTSIESQLDDSMNTLPEYNANSDGKSSLDGARCDLYYLKDEIEKAIITDKKLDPSDRFADDK